MALFPCPECQSEISDKAVSCPHCGSPVPAGIAAQVLRSDERGRSDVATESLKGRGGFRRPSIMLLAIALTFLLLSTILLFYGNPEADGMFGTVSRLAVTGLVGGVIMTIVLGPYLFVEWLAERFLPTKFRVGSIVIYDKAEQVARLATIVIWVVAIGALFVFVE